MSPLNITQPLDSIRYMVYNGYYKVMSNSPKMGHLTTPVQCPISTCFFIANDKINDHPRQGDQTHTQHLTIEEKISEIDTPLSLKCSLCQKEWIILIYESYIYNHTLIIYSYF